MSKFHQGARSYHDGLAAEDAVARHFERRGYDIVERRWRGKQGEIDLIARNDTGLIFVEVKKSADFAQAALRLSARQLRRIVDTALEFLAETPQGQQTEFRFDLALVDATGQLEVIENITL